MKLPGWIARIAGSRQDGQAVPEELDLSKVVPMLVPRSFSEGGRWPGPIYHLEAEEFDQTWGVALSETRSVYVARDMQAHWEAAGENWQQIAEDNMIEIVASEPFNRAMTREDGSVFLAAMLYGGNFGPGRLLIPCLFDQTFPEGYFVCVPERTCAIAFTATPTPEEAQVIDQTIADLYENGTEPVSLKRYPPDAFWRVTSDDVGLDG